MDERDVYDHVPAKVHSFRVVPSVAVCRREMEVGIHAGSTTQKRNIGA
jgi:hypothetical protein